MRPSLTDRMQRMLAVLAWLAANKRTTVSELADRFEVSESQMEKDLVLATMSGYGPDYDPSTMLEFFIDDDGTVEAYALKRDLVGPTRLTRAEAFAVLTAGRAALDIDPTLDALRSAMAKLAEALGADMDDVVDVDLAAPGCLSDFRTAEAGQRQVNIEYWSASRDEVTKRTVDPIYVFFRDGAWYARCVDHLGSSKAVRLFRLDRITSWALTDQPFVPPARIDTTDAVFDPPPDSRAVTIRFPQSSRWIMDYLDLREVHEDDRSFTGVLDVVGTAFLDQWLVRSRGQVIDPPELRGRTAIAASAILTRYDHQ